MIHIRLVKCIFHIQVALWQKSKRWSQVVQTLNNVLVYISIVPSLKKNSRVLVTLQICLAFALKEIMQGTEAFKTATHDTDHCMLTGMRVHLAVMILLK